MDVLRTNELNKDAIKVFDNVNEVFINKSLKILTNENVKQFKNESEPEEFSWIRQKYTNLFKR